MNEMIMAWVRPAALIIVITVACYMEIFQLKVSEFFIGLVTTIVVWFFKDRADEQRQKQADAQVVATIQAAKGEPVKNEP